MSKPSRFYRDIDGILLLDKALYVSSNTALQQVRALFNAAKAGHAGSLDPLASGVLPVCFGQATKVCGRLLSSGKTYRVLVRLGQRTESGDGETEVIERAAVPTLDDRAVDAVLATFLGEQEQVPPMHSALKFEGKRLYELARRGQSVEREARRIVIHRIARVRLDGEELEFDVYCSKGTYIRTLAADVAARLGTLGYVRGLRRLSLDPFDDLPMYTLEQLTALEPPARDAVLLQPDRAFPDLPRIELGAEAVAGLLQGRTVPALQSASPGELRAYDGQGRFLGMVQGAPDGRVRPVRLFVDVASGG
ncbi:MAG TPA: tRNA pseudouridine(55) synthase TruB [Steroidobacteraceae bacterium]|nr:tRNA pseudouridine(55) synthase TruB [Steroidobacteraceae bacterium]